MKTEMEKVERNIWGAVKGGGEGYLSAKEILCDAFIAGVIEEEYCDVDRKHRGSALNYDLYDYAEGVILVQQRYTTCDKYGNHPQKNYLLLIRAGDGVAKADAPHKMAIARASKLGLAAGKIIEKICKTQKADEIFSRFIAVPRLEGKLVAYKEVAA